MCAHCTASPVLPTPSRLTNRDRVLLGLRFGADLPFAEIGARLGLSEHTASVAAYRAGDRLVRTSWSRRPWPPDRAVDLPRGRPILRMSPYA